MEIKPSFKIGEVVKIKSWSSIHKDYKGFKVSIIRLDLSKYGMCQGMMIEGPCSKEQVYFPYDEIEKLNNNFKVLYETKK